MLRGLAIIIHKCYTYYIVKNKLVINHQQAIDQLLDISFFYLYNCCITSFSLMIYLISLATY